MNKWDRGTEPDVDFNDQENKEFNSKYTSETKLAYIFSHIIAPLLNGIVLALYYFPLKGWIKRHEN